GGIFFCLCASVCVRFWCVAGVAIDVALGNVAVLLGLREINRAFRSRLTNFEFKLGPRVFAELGEFPERWQIAKRTQAKQVQESRSRTVYHWPTGFILFSQNADQLTLEEQLQHGAGINASNVVDFWSSDRLTIGDNRERLELRATESHGSLRQILTNIPGIGRVSAKRIALGN